MARYLTQQWEERRHLERLKEMETQFNTSKPLEKYFHKAIELIFSGKISDATLRGSGIHPNIKKINDFYRSIKSVEEAEKCKNVFMHLHKQKAFKLLEDEKLLGPLQTAMSMSLFWVREFHTWEKSSHNIHKQFSSILRHMFAKYPVPLFLDEAWTNPYSKQYIDWFIHIGAGRSAKELHKFPIAITKKLAHEFVNTPEGFSINEAIRRAEVLSMGGSEWLAWHICHSRLGHGYGDIEREKFWSTVVLFFCKCPMFDCEHIPQILDYINHIKNILIPLEVEPGLFRPVANTNFSMKGRTLEALIRDSQEWHNRIAVETKHTKSASSWEGTKIKSFYLTEGNAEKGLEKTYSITELLKASELVAEGRSMNHCVSSYASSCQRGHCSIWSLRVTPQYKGITERLVTIELLNQSRTIVQVRGKSNCRPTEKEKGLVTRWAHQSGLRISNTAFGGW